MMILILRQDEHSEHIKIGELSSDADPLRSSLGSEAIDCVQRKCQQSNAIPMLKHLNASSNLVVLSSLSSYLKGSATPFLVYVCVEVRYTEYRGVRPREGPGQSQ